MLVVAFTTGDLWRLALAVFLFAVGISLAVSVGSLFAVGPVVDLTKHAVAALPF